MNPVASFSLGSSLSLLSCPLTTPWALPPRDDNSWVELSERRERRKPVLPSYFGPESRPRCSRARVPGLPAATPFRRLPWRSIFSIWKTTSTQVQAMRPTSPPGSRSHRVAVLSRCPHHQQTPAGRRGVREAVVGGHDTSTLEMRYPRLYINLAHGHPITILLALVSVASSSQSSQDLPIAWCLNYIRFVSLSFLCVLVTYILILSLLLLPLAYTPLTRKSSTCIRYGLFKVAGCCCGPCSHSTGSGLESCASHLPRPLQAFRLFWMLLRQRAVESDSGMANEP